MPEVQAARPATSPPDGPAFVFIDRDGTLVRHIPYLCDPDQIEVLPTVREGLIRLREAGSRLFLHTNQSGIGRGYFKLDQALACNERMIQLLDLGPDLFEDMCIAPEKPDDEQVYRKPSSRFAEEVLSRHGARPEQLFYIGDSASDVMTALQAGGTGLGVDTGEIRFSEAFPGGATPEKVIVYGSFGEAAEYIVRECTRA